jgi:putative ABC transport system ATP-binding protein
MNPIIEVRGLRKTYTQGDHVVNALSGVDLTIQAGQFTSIMGPSGSGKSTMLHLMGGLDRPSAGQVLIGGQAIQTLSDDSLSEFRRRKLGFIFQFFNLLPTLTAVENVALPLLLDGKPMSKIQDKAAALLDLMGLKDRMHHRPDQLSGGQMQRVAIARALVTDPLLILADEPTGNLDSATGTAVLELLRGLVKTQGQTVVMVTHDPKAASYADRRIVFRDGNIDTDDQVGGAATTGMRARPSIVSPIVSKEPASSAEVV